MRAESVRSLALVLGFLVIDSSCARCSDTCPSARDGTCSDGGSDTVYYDCELGTDCTDCGPRPDPSSSQASSAPAPPSGQTSQATANCANTCEYASDGICNDGGDVTAYFDCALGTDCADCGPRNGGLPQIAQSRSDQDAIAGGPAPPLGGDNLHQMNTALVILGVIALLAGYALGCCKKSSGPRLPKEASVVGRQRDMEMMELPARVVDDGL